MTLQVMEAQTDRSRDLREPSVGEIIAAGRSKSGKAPSRGAWLLAGLSAVLLWASFTPLDWGPLGWVALVPLILLVRIERRTRWMYTAVYAAGLLNAAAMLQWMRLGDVTMYTAWIALSFYIGMYFPAFVLLSRMAVHRLRVPLTLAVPVVWVGLEFLQAHLMTGFAWYYIGHTQYRWAELIQISDLVGAYGVSFVVMTSAACLAGLLPRRLMEQLKLVPAGAAGSKESSAGLSRRQIGSLAFSLTLFGATLAYGYVRRAQADFREGPRIAVVQGNFTSEVKQDPERAYEIYRRHYFLTGQAVKHRPEVIVWPETMYRMPLMIADPNLSDDDLQRIIPELPPERWRDSRVPEQLADLSKQAGAAMIIGINAGVATEEGFRRYNSAAFVKPREGLIGRYDKLHRVVFGEFVPFRDQIPWLHMFTPFSSGYGIDAGERPAIFEHETWRLAPIICFEDTVPHLVTRIVGTDTKTNLRTKAVDCLVNLTNDGWFHGSSELDQHLITAAFRCVESRTPMVRAVNTGISAVIDGDGVIVEPDVMLDGGVLLEKRNEQIAEAIERMSALDSEAGEANDATADTASKPMLNKDASERAAEEQELIEAARISMRDPETGRWHRQMDAILVDDVPLDNRRSLYVMWGDWFAATCFFGCVTVFLSGLVWRRKPETGEQVERG